MLLLVVLAFAALRRGHGFAAGCWLGLGLFKFQLALPLMLVLVVTQSRNVRTGLVKGFGVAAVALGGLSAAISGWSVFLIYPKFLLHLKTQPFAGVVPQAMANFRGLIYLFFHSDQSSRRHHNFVDPLRSRADRDALGMEEDGDRITKTTSIWLSPTHCIFALLVSYHLNPHDLSLLLLPIALLFRRASRRTRGARNPADWIILGWVGILFLPPLHLWTLRGGVYALMSLPLLGLFLSVAFPLRREEASAVD